MTGISDFFFFYDVYFYSISTILTIVTLLTQNKVSVHNTKLHNITFPFFKNYNPVQALNYDYKKRETKKRTNKTNNSINKTVIVGEGRFELKFITKAFKGQEFTVFLVEILDSYYILIKPIFIEY